MMKRRRFGCVDVLEELRLADRRVTDDTDVEVATQVHAFRRLLVHATHELQQYALLDNLVTIHGRRDARDEARVNVVAPDHRLEVLHLFARQALEELFAVLLDALVVRANVGRARL